MVYVYVHGTFLTMRTERRRSAAKSSQGSTRQPRGSWARYRAASRLRVVWFGCMGLSASSRRVTTRACAPYTHTHADGAPIINRSLATHLRTDASSCLAADRRRGAIVRACLRLLCVYVCVLYVCGCVGTCVGGARWGGRPHRHSNACGEHSLTGVWRVLFKAKPSSPPSRAASLVRDPMNGQA